ncbi:MAG: DUF488 domain-containing protein [Chloroflexia bacterium]
MASDSITKPTVVTIGAYGFDADAFFTALQDAGVDTFCDLRARRGVRGSAYAFANSARLQRRLGEMGIRYIHVVDLAPGPKTRAIQSEADKRSGLPKRARPALAPSFIAAYQAERLADFDPARFVADLGPDAHVVCLFCVEGNPAACHRSLVAQRLADDLGLHITHITASHPDEELAPTQSL